MGVVDTINKENGLMEVVIKGDGDGDGDCSASIIILIILKIYDHILADEKRSESWEQNDGSLLSLGILAGAGDWNKRQQLRLPPKRESIYLHMSQRPKEGDPGSGLLPSSSPHFGKSWRLEQKCTSPTPAKKREHLILP